MLVGQMAITTQELRDVFTLLIDNIESYDITSLDLDPDYYWYIQPPDVYNPYEDPKDLTLGQLSFDVDDMKGLLAKKRLPVGYDLVKLAAILRAIGDSGIEGIVLSRAKES